MAKKETVEKKPEGFEETAEKFAGLADLFEHKDQLVRFYSSPAHKAAQSMVETMIHHYEQIALAEGIDPVKREEARLMRLALKKLHALPVLLMDIFKE